MARRIQWVRSSHLFDVTPTKLHSNLPLPASNDLTIENHSTPRLTLPSDSPILSINTPITSLGNHYITRIAPIHRRSRAALHRQLSQINTPHIPPRFLRTRLIYRRHNLLIAALETRCRRSIGRKPVAKGAVVFPGTPDPLVVRLVGGALHAGDLETDSRHSVEACGLVEDVACVVVLALYAVVI